MLYIILLVATISVLMIPIFFMQLGAGFIYAKAYGIFWGLILGTVSNLIGATIGAGFAMFLSRYCFRGFVI